MIKNDDNQIIEQILRGNGNLYEVLVKKYQKQVYTLSFRMLNDKEDAKDIAQNAFIKAYDNLDSFNNKLKFFSWIYRITLNECINAQKRQSRFDSIDGNTKFKRVADSDSIEANFETTERNKLLETALDSLKQETKALIIMKYYEDMSYEEIASALDIPVGKVKSRLFSARQVLKENLIEQGILQ
jgi:RNA polymerase sigma-70 factor, ECF subfamily